MASPRSTATNTSRKGSKIESSRELIYGVQVDESLPSLDADLDSGGGLETICAPHVPQLPPPGPPAGGAAHDQHRLGGNKVGINFRERTEQALVVPQSSSIPTPNKRPRRSLTFGVPKVS